MPDYSNALAWTSTNDANGFDASDHTNDVWLSADGLNEPLSTVKTIVGAPQTISNNNVTNNSGQGIGYLYTWPAGAQPLWWTSQATELYTSTANVWLPPGSVDYLMQGTVLAAYVSDYTNPTQTVTVQLSPGQSNMLVVPGYITDGIICDVLDLPYPDSTYNGGTSYPRYRTDNFNESFMWPDDTTAVANASEVNGYTKASSVERDLMFRNYVNLLTGYYIFRPDDPLSSSVEPLTGANRPLHGNGPYYPSAGFYWPFDLVGVESGANFALTNATSDPDPTDTGAARFVAYSINMLSTNAAPEYAGELFYAGTGGTNVLSGTTAASTQITSSATWQIGLPSWASAYSTVMTNEASHYPTNIGGAIWRPLTFNGSNNFVLTSNILTPLATFIASIFPTDSHNSTGGYVSDGNGNIYRNTMAYAGRPTHYYDFSRSSWEPIPNNHLWTEGSIAPQDFVLPLGNWMTQEYAWHARAQNITIYTVGYGSAVNAYECGVLAQVANATNIISPGASQGTLTTNSRSYNSSQPIGQQFYATTPQDISNDFYQVGTAINGALTQ
jgi:hypothetical protein